MEDVIKFYHESGYYGEFSNFAAYPIKLDGKTWPTSEHYFQAQKFEKKEYQEKIRKSSSPIMAAQLGRSRKERILKNWDNLKQNIMYEAVKAKFVQHPDLKKLLLDTGNAKIIEHTENDSYWGDAGNGTGKNMLGKILMRLRDEIKKEENSINIQ